MNKKYNKVNIFGEINLRDYLDKKKHVITESIDNEKENYLLNVNVSDYANYKIEEGRVERLEIHRDHIYATSYEKLIPAEKFPSGFHVFRGKKYRKNVIRIHVPFSGSDTLLRCIPNRRILWTIPVEIVDREFSFEIVNFNDDADKISRDKDYYISNIMEQFQNIEYEINEYNLSIESYIKNAIELRKKRIFESNRVLESLGIPFKKSGDVSSTFSIPRPEMRNKIAISRPKATEQVFSPEPTLDKQIYFDILSRIHDVGREFERLPSLYAEKVEEHLRDHFLLMLSPHFQGSATGETFNKTGKTDILLRHDGSNVFIAECKFWRGKKSFLDTITQLLGYLTWRDSKAAVIIFVPNQDFSSVIKTVKETVSNHSNFVNYLDTKDETWINYSFHLTGDRNRLVSVAVMLYHTPRGNTP